MRHVSLASYNHVGGVLGLLYYVPTFLRSYCLVYVALCSSCSCYHCTKYYHVNATEFITWVIIKKARTINAFVHGNTTRRDNVLFPNEFLCFSRLCCFIRLIKCYPLRSWCSYATTKYVLFVGNLFGVAVFMVLSANSL